jgi:hypothetical protein
MLLKRAVKMTHLVLRRPQAAILAAIWTLTSLNVAGQTPPTRSGVTGPASSLVGFREAQVESQMGRPSLRQPGTWNYDSPLGTLRVNFKNGAVSEVTPPDFEMGVLTARTPAERAEYVEAARTKAAAALKLAHEETVAKLVAKAGADAQGQQMIVILKIQSQVSDPSGLIAITFASGTRILVPSSDIALGSTAVDQSVLDKNEPVAGAPARTAAAPSPASAAGTIRSKCSAEWPGDFTMRAYCEKQQQEALGKIGSRAMASGDRLMIRTTCTKEWPNDFQMQNYCEEQQLKALDSLR